MKDFINIEVCYATPEKQLILPLQLPTDACVADAIAAAKILEIFPDIDLHKNRVGIFGRLCKLDTRLRDQDRVEIYRTLMADPKEARRKRAAGKLTG